MTNTEKINKLILLVLAEDGQDRDKLRAELAEAVAAEQEEQSDVSWQWVAATKALRYIGIPANMKGYVFIRDAVILAEQDRSILEDMTKRLYPEVAEMHGTDWRAVERAIRNAIARSYTGATPERMQRIFGNNMSTRTGLPTVSALLCVLTDLIQEKGKRY